MLLNAERWPLATVMFAAVCCCLVIIGALPDPAEAFGGPIMLDEQNAALEDSVRKAIEETKQDALQACVHCPMCPITFKHLQGASSSVNGTNLYTTCSVQVCKRASASGCAEDSTQTLLLSFVWKTMEVLGCNEESPSKTIQILSESDDIGDSLAVMNAWLAANNLNSYGDPVGVAYPGGSPLFNERTGERMNIEEYLRAKFPESPWKKATV